MRIWIVCIAMLVVAAQSFGLEMEDDAVFARVLDVGAGEAVVVRMPGPQYLVYDTGHWQGEGKVAYDGVAEIIPDGATIDLLVLSHSDADHQGAVKRILDHYTVKRILRGGLERVDSATWTRGNQAIAYEREADGALDLNLKRVEFPPGATYRFGDAFVTMVSGFYAPPDSWDIEGGSEGSEFRNAGSIVIRLEFHGRSILFAGDAVGRHLGDPPDALIATEKFMVENSPVIKIDSDVLVAPHHGADNASSNAFIEAVSPEWVIFSAGHKYGHPRAVTVERYLAHGLPLDHLLRTDRGDDETAQYPEEWSLGRIAGATDPVADDDVDVLLRPDGNVLVEYRHP